MPESRTADRAAAAGQERPAPQPALRGYRCAECGYGIRVAVAPARCPMCGEAARWRPLPGSVPAAAAAAGRAGLL